MTEECSILVDRKLYPCFQRDVLAAETAFQFAFELVVTVRFHCHGVGRFRTVLHTRHLEVVVGQITGSYRFVEGNLRIVVDGQYAVGSGMYMSFTPLWISEKFSTSTLLMLHTDTAQRS